MILFITSICFSLVAESSTCHYDNKFYDSAMYYYRTGDFDTSMYLFRKALALNKKLNDTTSIGETYNRIGIIYREQGEYTKALEFFQSALFCQEKVSNKEGIAQVYNSIGILYMAWKNYQKAIDYYNLALGIYTQTNKEDKQADVLNNIGLIYRYTEQYDSAMIYFRQSIKIREKDGEESGIASSLHNIGTVYNATKDYKKALDYYFRALKIREAISARKDVAVSLNAIGKTYMNLTENEKADSIFRQALNIARPLQLTEMIVTLYENMTINYSALEDHEKFNEYFNLYIGYYDSVFNEDKHRQLMDLQTRYETEKKEQKIKMLQNENRIQQLENKNNRLLLLVLIIVITAIIFSGIILYRHNKLNAEKRIQSLRQKMLQLQMNPHFIFNAMGAIQDYIYDKEPLKAGSYLSNFSRLFRFILESSNKDFISLSEEIEMLEYYIQIQQLRFKKAFDYSFEVDETIDPENQIIPPMILQPFVENAIEHGLRKLESGGKISVSVKKHDVSLSVEIRDNGIGINKSLSQVKSKNQDHRSLATEITRERLQLFNRKNKTVISFEIKEHPDGGTVVNFNIPVRQK